MADFTDQLTQRCETEAVFAVDVLDTARHLLIEHISVDETLADCGCDQAKCDILKEWINKRRKVSERKELTDEQNVTPFTTIRQVISYVC